MPERVNRGPGFPVDGAGLRQPQGSLRPAPRKAPRWSGSAWAGPPWRPRCQGCGERGVEGLDLCPACDAALPRIRMACATCGLPLRAAPADAGRGGPGLARSGDLRCDACRQAPPPLSRVVAPFLYAPPFDRWLPRFKFHHDLAAGRLLSQLMLDACAAAPRPDVLVPVPLHRARLRSRGYDQARELAKPLARTLALPLRTDLLLRTRATSAQSTLHARERRDNLRGAFAISPPFARGIPGYVALVDDVMTTGSTLHAAAEALLEAGVSRVDAWICARAC